MKKILAMILVLCMAVAAVPALAEVEITGTWYMLVMGLTVATFEVKDDGTCTVTMENGEEEEMKAEGTWTKDGDSVTLKLGEEQTIPLTVDGETLTMGAEAVSEIAGDLGGLEASMITAMVQISREPGKISMAELNAFQDSGKLPEGKTQADMEAIQAEMMLMVFAAMGMSESDVSAMMGGSDTPATEDAPVLSVVEENFYVRESYFGMEGVYIAKVQNNTETTLIINGGQLVIKDADGNEIGRKEYLGTCGSRYLDPGEVSFVSLLVDVGEGLTVNAYEAKVEAAVKGYMSKDTELQPGSAELRSKEGYSGTDWYTAVSVTNPGDAPTSGIGVIAVTRASDGKMINIAEKNLGMNELGAGSTLVFVDSVDSAAVKYCEANGLTLDTVEAYAWAEEQ